MNIVVTGGAGFIGSHLCETLLRAGHQVKALDNFDEFYDSARKRKNLEVVSNHPRFQLIEGDIRNPEDVLKVVSPATQIVVHLAARAGVRPSIEQPLLYQDVNIRGTMILLEAVRRIKNCKFIFGSSSSVYGNNAKVPFAEDDNVDAPISLRGIVRAIERCKEFSIYNLGNSNPVSLNELIAALEHALGRKAIIERLPLQCGDATRTFADITLAVRELAFSPRTEFASGLARFVDWLREARRDSGEPE